MRLNKKIVFNGLFLAITFVITMFYIFDDQNFRCLIQYMKDANSVYWLIGICLVVLFILSESVIIWYMMKSLKQEINLKHCFLYSFIGFFFSLVTPSASGGQPAQVLFMKKDKIPIHLSTLVLLIVTITYKLVLVIIGCGVMIIRPAKVMVFLRPAIWWIWLGILLNVICVGIMLALVFSPNLAKNIVIKCFRWAKGFSTNNKIDSLEGKIMKSMEGYKAAATYFKENKKVIFNVLGITIIQRCFLFYITFLVLRSFNINNISMLEIVLLQAMISVATDMLPLPGGMGISEHLFKKIFYPICGRHMTLPTMIVSRGISYYTQLVISAIFSAVAYIVIFRRKEE
ncbi:MAG: lysylphosphatidylglycerol synthase transmembrane domain-containing protein [Eubacteriales bacterium]|nr:lysylphosphatidylglycerol synthase transmembrane domain-containing protein [Eubacteriales bacterium]